MDKYLHDQTIQAQMKQTRLEKENILETDRISKRRFPLEQNERNKQNGLAKKLRLSNNDENIKNVSTLVYDVVRNQYIRQINTNGNENNTDKLMSEEISQHKKYERMRKEKYRKNKSKQLTSEQLSQHRENEKMRIKSVRKSKSKQLTSEQLSQYMKDERVRKQSSRKSKSKQLTSEQLSQHIENEQMRIKRVRKSKSKQLTSEQLSQHMKDEQMRIKSVRKTKSKQLTSEQFSQHMKDERARKQSSRKTKLKQLTSEELLDHKMIDRTRKQSARKRKDSNDINKLRQHEKQCKQQQRNQSNIERAIQNFQKDITQSPEYVCTCCRRLLYRRTVTHVSPLSFPKVPKDIVDKCVTGRMSALGFQWICQTCATHIRKKNIPPQAICNKLDVTLPPAELTNLSPLEKRLISRRYPFMKLLALPKGKQKGIKGTVVNVPVNENDVCAQLPRLPSEAGLIPLRLKRKIIYKSHEKFEYVRPHHVKLGLAWLKSNNPLYQDVVECDNWETNCIEDDSELWTDLTTPDIDSNENISSGNASIDKEINEKCFISTDASIHETIHQNKSTEASTSQNIEPSCTLTGVTLNGHSSTDTTSSMAMSPKRNTIHKDDKQSIPDDTDDYTDDVVNKLRGIKYDTCIQPSDPTLDADKVLNIAAGEGKKPMSILMDEHFEELAFPHLLPSGKFGYKCEREIKLTPKKYFTSRLLNEHKTFASDIEYIFVAQTIVETKQIFDSMNIALRKAFCTSSSSDNINAGFVRNPETMKLCLFKDQGYRFLQSVRGTPPYWQKVQYKLLAAIKQLGMFTWFFTLSAADLRWHDTIQSIARQSGQILSDENVDGLSWEQKCEWLRSNPLTAARHFQYRLDCIMKNVILSDAKPVGEVLHFFYRIEFQQRGSPHCHGVLWIKDAPHPERSTPAEITAFVDRYVSSQIPSAEEDQQLHSLVTQLQKHTHSASCRKTGRQCRFNFPKPISTSTILSRPSDFSSEDTSVNMKEAKQRLANVKTFLHDCQDLDNISIADVLAYCGMTEDVYHEALEHSATDTSVFMRRNPCDVNINNYSPEILRAWQANMDFQFVSNPYACIQYVVAYITKDEREMGTLLQAVSKETADQGIQQQMKKCARAFTNSRSVSAQEAIYRVLGLPLHKSDFQTIWIPTGLPHQRVHLLKSNSVLDTLEEEDENIFVSSMEEKYAARPDVLTSWCLSYFVSWYTASSLLDTNDVQPDILEDVQLPVIDNPADFLAVADAPEHFVICTSSGATYKMKKRKKQALIRYHTYSILREPESFYYSELFLFVPWRTDDDILHGYPSYHQSHEAHEETIQETKSVLQQHRSLVDAAVEDFTENGPRSDSWDLLNPEAQQAAADQECEGAELDPEYSFLHPNDVNSAENIPLPVSDKN
ncbi:MAG: DUF6570 domain-containing protein, partial [Sedimenticola sp.]